MADSDWLEMGAHICVVVVDAGDALLEPLLLLVLVRYDWIAIDVAELDLEAGLVGNPVAIPDRGWHRRDVSGHIMEDGARSKGQSGWSESDSRGFRSAEVDVPSVACVVQSVPRRNLAEKWFGPSPAVDVRNPICLYVKNIVKQASTRASLVLQSIVQL